MNKKHSNKYLNYFKNLKKNNELYKINELKTQLTDTSLLLKENYFTRYFNINIQTFELSVIQFIKMHCLELNFNKNILKAYNSKSKFSSPLPKRWQDHIVIKKININKFMSSFKWLLLCMKYYFKSYKTIYILFYESLKNIFYKNDVNLQNCIFINNLNKDIISSQDLSSTAINWLKKNQSLKNKKCFQNSLNIKDFKFNNSSIIYRKKSFPYLSNFRDFSNFSIWILKSHYYLICDLFKNYNLINFLFYSEFIESYLHKNLTSENNIFLFNNSNSLYRPLWTFIIEKKNSKVFFYFYSTNNEPIIDINSLPLFGWYPLTWNNYLIAHKQQLNFINSVTKVNYKYQIADVFDHSIKSNVSLPDNFILAFDISPQNDVEFSYSGEMYDYFSYDKIEIFLNDIVNIVSRHGINLVLKTKKLNVANNRKYQLLIKKISALPNIYICSTNLTLENLIQNSKLVISYPFSSPSLIAKNINKKSIYYDPLQLITHNHNNRLGINLINTKIELENLILKCINN